MIVIFASAELFRGMRSSDKKIKPRGSHPSFMSSCSCDKKKKLVNTIKELQLFKISQAVSENEKYGTRKQGIFHLFSIFTYEIKDETRGKNWRKFKTNRGRETSKLK